jgi:hypothetical protein
MINIIPVIKSRRMRWAGHVARMGEGRRAYRIFVGRPEGRRPLGRPRHRWEDNIKMDLQELGWGGMGWFQLHCYFIFIFFFVHVSVCATVLDAATIRIILCDQFTFCVSIAKLPLTAMTSSLNSNFSLAIHVL